MITPALSPAAALFHQAETAFRKKDFAACANLCERALEQEPEQIPLLRLLGAVRYKLGRRDEGAAALERALRLAPNDLSLRLDYGCALQGLGALEQSAEVLREGLRQAPYQPDLVTRLAPVLSDLDRHGEAQELLQGAIKRWPRNVELRFMLATEYAADMRTEEALAHLLVAGEMDPNSYTLNSNLGVLYHGMGLYDTAIRAYERALEQNPGAAQTHFNLSTSLLLCGEWERGFREMEWRTRLPNLRRPVCVLPAWSGQPLKGKRLLVSAEQGLGDMIQFTRFIPRLKALEPAEILVECQPELTRLLERVEGVTGMVPLEARQVEADYSLSMMSLPYATGVTRDQEVFGPIPYLAPPPGPRFALPEARGLKVGLIWASRISDNTLYVRRSLNRRSCPLEVLAKALAPLAGVTLYSLQKGPRDSELELLRDQSIHDLAPRLHDMADTAAAMMELDLVISVDTSTVHLAGALGRPTWALLTNGQVDFRWGRGEERSPWYPRTRLFRANRTGWPGLMVTVAAELAALAEGKGRLWAAPL